MTSDQVLRSPFKDGLTKDSVLLSSVVCLACKGPFRESCASTQTLNFLVVFCGCSATMSMHLDTTIYPVGFVPEQLLKNLMAKERLFAGIRLAWAMREMTTIQRMAVVGDTATEAFTNLSTPLQESDWPAAPSAREPETFKIKAIWAQSVRRCSTPRTRPRCR